MPFKNTCVIGQPDTNRPILIGLLTSDTAIKFSSGKPVGNLDKSIEN